MPPRYTMSVALVALAMALGSSGVAQASTPRVILAEDFTAVW